MILSVLGYFFLFNFCLNTILTSRWFWQANKDKFLFVRAVWVSVQKINLM
jgi:hypothetical protein